MSTWSPHVERDACGAANPASPPRVWQAGRFQVDLTRPRVMGIVNATPDSFFDGGRHAGTRNACLLCDRLVAEGADILDIGGESTRPGSVMPSWQVEAARVLPVVRHAVTLGVPVSVDASRPEVIAEALAAGADIINDIRALTWPGALACVAAQPDVGVCLMHMQGEPSTMQRQPHYDRLLDEVRAFLAARVQAVRAAAVADARVVLDPGYGFGKSSAHNWALLCDQAQLLELGFPLLAGWSRKASLGELTGRPLEGRLVASVVAALAAAARGARILRVHDVAATKDALQVWHAAGL